MEQTQLQKIDTQAGMMDHMTQLKALKPWHREFSHWPLTGEA